MYQYKMGKDMDDFKEKLSDSSEEELQELKSWLFRENIRVAMAQKELEQNQKQFEEEKMQFQEEMKLLSRRIASDRQRLREDEQFFSKKLEILQNGFAQLDIDRRRLEKERMKFETQKEFYRDAVSYERETMEVSAFFKGVRNPLALKKRYKDLIKIFHPDNLAGDKDIIQQINSEYETLKGEYDNFKQA